MWFSPSLIEFRIRLCARIALPSPGVFRPTRRVPDGPLHASPVLVEREVKGAGRQSNRLAVDQHRVGIGNAVRFLHRDEAPFSTNLDILLLVGFGSGFTIYAYYPPSFR